MNIKAGTLLISTPSLDDPNFEKVVIFIAEYNEKGALGFVINKLFPRAFNELIEFKDSKAFRLYEGGPVEKENIFFLHQRPDVIDGGTHVIDSIYLGGNFKQAVANIDRAIITENQIKLFVGYCGWDLGQLEEEVEEGSWIDCSADNKAVFSFPVEMLWDNMYNRIG